MHDGEFVRWNGFLHDVVIVMKCTKEAIWDFKDQAIQVTDPITAEVMRYGGDFDDKPSDYEFSGMGSFCRWTRKTRHGGKILL